MFSKILIRQKTRQFRAFSSAVGEQKKVAFVGLGSMGLPMASNLVKNGFAVNGFDLQPKALEQGQQMGIEAKTSIKEACTQVDYVVTSLPKTQHVEEAMFGTDGVLDSSTEGTCIIDVSTITPMLAQQIQKGAEEKSLIFCDCPMAGGTIGAKNGTLVFMVGSKTVEHYELAKVVLEGMGKKFFHCGQPGNGQAVKLSHNLTLGINMIASVEGMVLGEKLGIDPVLLMEILQSSTSSNACMGIYNPRPGNNPNAPSSRDYKDGFQTGLMKKDMGLAIQSADANGVKTEFAKRAWEYYDTIEQAGHSNKDFGFIYQLVKGDMKI